MKHQPLTTATTLTRNGGEAERVSLPPEEEFARSVLAEQQYLLRVARGLTRHRENAEDLLQTTVLKALAARERFQTGSNLVAWLTVIMKNEFLSRIKKHRREVEDVDGGHAATLSVQADEGGGEESRDRVQRALAALPEIQRAVISMTLAGVPAPEIARRLNISEITVRSRTHRARQTLMAMLGEGRQEEKTQASGVVRGTHDRSLEIRKDETNPTIRSFDVSEFPPVVAGPEPGERPEQSWLSIESLRIDERYQRSILRAGYTNIVRIAQSFDWRKFTPVIVARWEGVYYVVDGQHRTYGALLRGMRSVPCMIFEAPPSVAADAFAAINNNVTRIHRLQVFGARLAAGDEAAVLIDRVCREAGVEIKHYPVPQLKMRSNQTIALGVLETGLRRHGEEGLKLALRLLVTAHPDERGVLSAPLIRAACAVAGRLLGEDVAPEAAPRAVRGVSFTALWREVGVRGDLAGAVLVALQRRLQDDL